MPYGFSDHLPQPHVYLTILREPIQRMLSQYNFGNEKGGWPESHDPKLLIEQGLMVDNPQVRQIAGCTDKREPCDEAMLEQAIKNLDNKYQFVGVAERFNDLLESLITAFQWPDVIYGYFNEGKRKESPPSQNFIDTLREFNEFDVKLYAHAVARKSPIADNIISIDLKTHVKAVGLQTKVVVVAPMKIRGEYYPLVDRAEIKTLKSELESLGFTIHRFSNTDSNGAKGMESTPSH